ncbi:CNT_HP2_G0018490.mRNA.1.CDS.1 [Saccharomyces cerevisiae]|nr:CNT_HP2_G0018490.mRNA.1.CDS.1 [Saccharomyces cerevisiae]CAI6538618.1 CNT_HP2_G0018490.mRNA.1.CDS.1 [Saccharomyces cerevisiae]
MHALLNKLLNDQEISNPQEWITLRDGALQLVVDLLKKSEYIDGVVFSKRIAVEKMPRHFEKPQGYY